MTIDNCMFASGEQKKTILIQFKTDFRGKNVQFPYFDLDLVKVSDKNLINFLLVAPPGISACDGNKTELVGSISSTVEKVYSKTL